MAMHDYTIAYVRTHVQELVTSRTYFNKLLCEVAESELMVGV